MKQERKNQLILFIWLAVKLLVTARYFYDTFTVALGEGTPLGIAILDGVLIDGVFAALWIVVSFGGQGKTMLSLRPFAAAGAWLLYALMLRVAETNGSVALLARYAGGLGLAYDTMDIVLAWLQKGWEAAGSRLHRLQANRTALTLAERQAQMRARAWKAAYGLALLLLRPVVWIASGVLVLGDLYADLRAVWGRSHQAQALSFPTSEGRTLTQTTAPTHLLVEETDAGQWVAVCTLCGWRSQPAETPASCNKAYAGHTRGKAHRAALNAEASSLVLYN